MKKIGFFTIAISLLLWTSCNSGGSSSNTDRPKSPEELKAELKMQEQFAPTDYLRTEGSTMKHNEVRKAGLFRDAEYDGWLVEGTIKNSATITRFKDVIVTIKLFSQTETVIEEKDYAIYEFFEPNSSKPFSIKITPPKVTDKFNVSVKTATATE